MACVLTLDDGRRMYTLPGETGYVWCATPRVWWRMGSTSSFTVLLMLLLGSKVQIFFSKVVQ